MHIRVPDKFDWQLLVPPCIFHLESIAVRFEKWHDAGIPVGTSGVCRREGPVITSSFQLPVCWLPKARLEWMTLSSVLCNHRTPSLIFYELSFWLWWWYEYEMMGMWELYACDFPNRRLNKRCFSIYRCQKSSEGKPRIMERIEVDRSI